MKYFVYYGVDTIYDNGKTDKKTTYPNKKQTVIQISECLNEQSIFIIQLSIKTTANKNHPAKAR